LAAFGAVRSIKDLDCPTAPPCRQQFERDHAHGHVVIRARSHRLQSPWVGIHSSDESFTLHGSSSAPLPLRRGRRGGGGQAIGSQE
jgi:hypothetical protein